MARRRRMTAARRRQIRMAQRASARKRKRSSDTLGHWVAKGARKVVSVATMGTSSMLVEFMQKPNKKKK